VIQEGEFRLRDPALATTVRLDVRTAAPGDGDALGPLMLDGEGTYRDFPFTLDGRVESPLQLQSQTRPYRVGLNARAGATQARARGELYSPLQFHDFDVRFSLKGNDLADLFPLVGIALPQTPPYALDGRLQRDGASWYYRGFAGTVGDSDLAGDVTVNMSGERPLFTAKLTSKKLDFDDLAGFLGLPPSSAPGETASPAQTQARAARSE